jgi:hypothetical protein
MVTAILSCSLNKWDPLIVDPLIEFVAGHIMKVRADG